MTVLGWDSGHSLCRSAECMHLALPNSVLLEEGSWQSREGNPGLGVERERHFHGAVFGIRRHVVKARRLVVWKELAILCDLRRNGGILWDDLKKDSGVCDSQILEFRWVSSISLRSDVYFFLEPSLPCRTSGGTWPTEGTAQRQKETPDQNTFLAPWRPIWAFLRGC